MGGRSARPASDPVQTQSVPQVSPQEARAEDVRAFAVELARLSFNTRCRNVAVLDVRGLSPVTDFMVVATGTSPRQMRTVVDEAEELAASKGYSAITRSGYEGESWILVDFVDVVVHVLSDESRVYYDLDNLWGDAKRVDWQAGMPAASATTQAQPIGG